MDYFNLTEALRLKLQMRGYAFVDINMPKSSALIMLSVHRDAFYALLILDDRNKFEDHPAIKAQLQALIVSQASSLAYKNIFVINVFVTESDNEYAHKMLESATPFIEGKMLQVYWWLRLDTNEIFNNKIQPSELDGIRRDIVKILSGNLNIEEQKLEALNKLKLFAQPPIVTYALLFINALLLLGMTFSGGSFNSDVLTQYGALNSYYVLENGEYYRLFSSIFLHIGFMHFFFNATSLLIFGSRFEKHVNRFKFLMIYIVSGIFGSALMLLSSPDAITAGASGSIFGLIGAMMTYTKRKNVTIGGLSFGTVLIIAAMNLSFGLLDPSIGNAAHIGGLIAGIVLGFTL